MNDAVREILTGGADHRERRAQLVRDRRDELELLARKLLRPARRDDQQRHAGGEHAENARS